MRHSSIFQRNMVKNLLNISIFALSTKEDDPFLFEPLCNEQSINFSPADNMAIKRLYIIQKKVGKDYLYPYKLNY